MASDKVKQTFLWLRRVMRITEKTTLPGEILGEIRATVDTFGWERMTAAVATSNAATNQSSVSAAPVPADTVRVVLAASVEISNLAFVGEVWLEHAVDNPGIAIGIIEPFSVAASLNAVRVGTHIPFTMNEADVLSARSSALSGVAATISIRQRFIDLPNEGEYIPAVF